MTPPDTQRNQEQVLDADRMHAVIGRMTDDLQGREDCNRGVILVGIRTRGVPLAEEMAQRIVDAGGDVQLGTLDITLYRDDLSTIAPNPVVRETMLPGSIDGRTVVLCDDVLFTGRTIRAALDALVDFGRPRAVRLAVLVDRGGRELPIQADVVGEPILVERDRLVDVRFAATDEGPEGVYLRDRSEEEE